MKRTYKYKNHISEWYDVDVGDVLTLIGKDGDIFDTVIIKEFPGMTDKCCSCSLSENGIPGECMHYAFACMSSVMAVSMTKVLEDL